MTLPIFHSPISHPFYQLFYSKKDIERVLRAGDVFPLLSLFIVIFLSMIRTTANSTGNMNNKRGRERRSSGGSIEILKLTLLKTFLFSSLFIIILTLFISTLHFYCYIFFHFPTFSFFPSFSPFHIDRNMATTVATQSLFTKFLNSPAGPKTIHFWAPMFKWVCLFFSPCHHNSLILNQFPLSLQFQIGYCHCRSR